MAIIINGVTCLSVSRDYKEGIDGRGPSASKGYLCNWNDRYTVANGLMGVVSFTGTGHTGTIKLPTIGNLPESPNAWALSIAIEGKGQPVQNAFDLGYQQAIVWVTYGVPEYGPGPEAQIDPATSFIFATQEVDQGVEYVTIPGQALAYADGTPSNIDRVMPVHHAELTITLHRMPYMPINTVYQVDNVNDSTFLGAAMGLVKYNGVKISRDYDTAGNVVQKSAFSFSLRPIADWNFVPDPKGTGTWVLLQYKAGGSAYQFPYSNLMSVFPTAYVG